MQEAFRRAMQQNPGSPMAPTIKDVSHAQAAERFRQRKEKQFAQLKKQYNSLGGMWYETKINRLAGVYSKHSHIPIEDKRKQWTQTLAFLKDKPTEQRIELLGEMASGMHLTDESIPTTYRETLLQDMLLNPLGYLGTMFSEINFARPSTLFMDAFSDMSSYSDKQKQEFQDFMIKKSGLKGEVKLPKFFPAISLWIDHSK